MATLKFFIKGNKNPSTIYLRFVHGRKIDLKCSSFLLVNPGDWNNKTGTVNNIKDFKLQNILNILKQHVLNDFNNSYRNGFKIDTNWVKESLINFKEKKHRVIKHFKKEQNAKTDIQKIGIEFNFELKRYTPYKPVVYFLIDNNEVVYIGKSISLPQRMANHLSEKVKHFDKMLYIDVVESELDIIEQQMIKRYKPKYNIIYNLN